MEIAGQDAELPEIRVRTRIFSVIVVLVFMALSGRLFYLQVIEGDAFYRQTSESVIRLATLPAMRGEIRDRDRRLLASTRPSYDVQVAPSSLSLEVYARLRGLLGTHADDLPDWDSLLALGKASRDRTLTLIEDIPRDTMAAIETTIDSPGVSIRPVPRRYYPQGSLFAHTLGFLNEVTAEEVRTRRDEGYRSGDLIGRTGVERQWESYLRGTKGFEKSVVDRRGVRRSDVRLSDLVEGPTKRDPVPGHSLILTLDLDLQRIAERALRGKQAAAVAVIDVDTGRVLALVSKPTFDPNEMSGKLSRDAETRILSDRLRPFRDKTLSETYNPGSTFKVISAIAALEEKIITPEDKTRCAGYVQVGGRRFKCRKAHGMMNLHNAIVQSCNAYFYDLGSRPGMMNRLAKFATELGLGAPSGLGLNGESKGLVPTEDWHREQGDGFVIGHALNTAIGEGATRASVIQLALAYAAIANGGRLWLPQIVSRVEAADGQVIDEFPPISRRDIAASPETLSTIRKALVGVVNDAKGTAYKARSRRLVIAGKTGTAQVLRTPRKKGGDPPLPYEQIDHAWFAGFAPADKPRIAFAVLVEHGGHGGDVAAPVRRK